MKVSKRTWMVIGAVALAAVSVVGVFVVHVACAERRAEEAAAARKAELARFGIVTDGRQDFVALPSMLPHGVRQAALGLRLFCERKLARTSRRTCAVCHSLSTGGSDGKVHGKVATRTIFNAPFASVYLHDGSVTNLPALIARMIEDQQFSGAGPLDRAVLRLAADEGLLANFRACYPDGLVASNVLDALCHHCRTLVTSGRPIDHYCGGRTSALDDSQKRGMELFRQRCLVCHDGPALGTQKMSEGVKVPGLRGVSQRSTYLTDGSLSDLGAVLTRMPVGALEEADRAALVSFLRAL